MEMKNERPCMQEELYIPRRSIISLRLYRKTNNKIQTPKSHIDHFFFFIWLWSMYEDIQVFACKSWRRYLRYYVRTWIEKIEVFQKKRERKFGSIENRRIERGRCVLLPQSPPTKVDLFTLFVSLSSLLPQPFLFLTVVWVGYFAFLPVLYYYYYIS